MYQASLEAARAAEEECLGECEALRQQIHGEKTMKEDLQQQRSQTAAALHELNHSLKHGSELRARLSELQEDTRKLKAANGELLDTQHKLQAELRQSHATREVYCPVTLAAKLCCYD